MSDAATTARPAYAKAWRNAIFVVFTLNGFGAAAWVSRIPSIRDHLGRSRSPRSGFLILGVSVGVDRRPDPLQPHRPLARRAG